ncbi:MAG: YlbF family regulator [Bacilli bacterium]|nr:YlbF family regulator [Bacilli bacterium]
MDELLIKISELREMIIKSELYQKVKVLENKLLDEERALIIDFKQKEDAYNDAIRLGYYNDSYLISLQKSKEKLYSTTNYQNYKNALNEMNDFLSKVSQLIYQGVIRDLD